MTSPDHAHAGFEHGPDRYGRPVDGELLGQFTGAAFDGCTTCQDALLTRIVDDPPTCARLVELACVATHGAFGGLPASMTDETSTDGVTSPEFRRLAHAGLDGANDAVFALCAQMTVAERRAAANTAADLLVGHLHLRGLPGGGGRRGRRGRADRRRGCGGVRGRAAAGRVRAGVGLFPGPSG
jgi:hypothetical protein